MLNFIRRIKMIRQTKLIGPRAAIFFHKNVLFFIEDGAEVIVSGKVTIGFSLPGLHPFPSNQHTVISLKKNSKLIFNGDTYIANGTGIYLDKNSTLEFSGNNSVAHNSTILCKNYIKYGLNSASSWNFNAIDDDGHIFNQKNGDPIPRKNKALIIGDNVAIKINVTIPRAITIGNGAIIGANTVLRTDVQPYTLVFHKNELVIKEGVTYAYQLSSESR